MHDNRNKGAIKKVEKGMMKANRIRNIFAVLAVVLTTFMITTVFSLGINYMQNMELSSVRTAGSNADVTLNAPTSEQEQQIRSLNYVKTIGDSAFQNCPALTYITIGARVEMIGKNAFRNDKRIREIEIKTNRLRKIGKKALRNTRRGKIIRVPAGKKKAYTKLIKAAK